MLKFLSVVLISICFNVSNLEITYASISCDMVFQKGQKYWLQTEGSSKIQKLKFLGQTEENGQVYFFFQEGYARKKLRIATEDISHWKKKETIPSKKDLVEGLIGFAKGFFLAPFHWHSIVKPHFIPHRTLLEGDRIRVDGQLWGSKTTAKKIIDTLESFDASMQSWGFDSPYFTKVLLTDKPIFPGFGPHALIHPTFSVRKFELASVIDLNSDIYDTAISLDPQSIRHERVHSSLLSQYKLASFVNSKKTFREAIADFLTAHFSGNPKIGVTANGAFLRDIEKMEGTTISIKTLLDLNSNFHDNSLIISNFLWKLRNRIGEKKMSTMLRPLLDSLNSYRNPFSQYTSDYRNQAIEEYEYLISVTLKLTRGTEFEDIVTLLAKESMGLFSLDFDKVNLDSRFLAEYSDAMISDKPKLLEVIAGYVGAGYFLGIESIAIFTLIRDLSN